MRHLLFVIVCYNIFADVLNDNNNCTFKIISREEWGADPPKRSPIPIKIYPPDYVIITQTLTQHCSNQRECFRLLRGIQYMHMKKIGWNDIADNFLVAGDGNVYEGRGWENEGFHTRNYNYKSISIAFVGDYSKIPATEQQFNVTQKLLEYGVRHYKIMENYKLLGHRQVSYSMNPGDKVYNIIKSWAHWVFNP